MNYTQYKNGSEWRKWDLHFHTPSSYDYGDRSVTNEEIVQSLSENEVSVVAITDHHVIDINRIKDLQLLAKSKNITVLPGIEFLSDTRGKEPIHFIGIFSENCNLEHIWGQIQNRTKIVEIGEKGKKPNEIYCNLESTLNLIKELDGISTIHAGVKSNSIENITHSLPHGSAQKTEIATKVDFYELGKPDDKEGYLKHVFPKIKRHIPMIICSDNHNIKKYVVKENCWIKADPTFEGLRQVVHEPKQRVRIQALKPDLKNDRHVISELHFVDKGKLFGNQKIQLSENLNAIIGGKSSGKSLLLYSIAKSIDPEQVERASKRLNFEGYNFENSFDFKVIWKNGDEDSYSHEDSTSKSHKITYIPQLYINYLVEKNNKEDLNILVKNILLQDSSFREFYDDVQVSLKDINSEIDRLANEYFRVRNDGIEVNRKSKDLGGSQSISKAINLLTVLIQKGSKTSNLSDQEVNTYNKLIREKSDLDGELRKISQQEQILNNVVKEVRNNQTKLIGSISESGNLNGSVDRILNELGSIEESFLIIKKELVLDYEKLVQNLKHNIDNLNFENQKNILNDKLKFISSQLKPLHGKLEGQKELKKLAKELDEEKQKLQSVSNFNQRVKHLIDEYDTILKQISALLENRFQLHKSLVDRVNQSKKEIGSDIQLESSLLYRQDKFLLFTQVNKASLSSDHTFHSLFSNSFVNYPKIIELFQNHLKVNEDKLFYSKNDYYPLRVGITLEDILRGLVKDSFEIDYTVTYKNDNLLHMSPGKKGTVLLILFLQISSSDFPILIDQPEDNLDNRTIYDLLCKMIKKRKRERQILIVSHNANLVVSTDAENVIVANQKGQGDKESKDRNDFRFEYINGALEHSKIKESGNSILLEQGIREHVCDILEGGGEAFKTREKKYGIKDS
jgi:ABC-type dipeptide/oligopeptide/nickel transport system ATPase component